MSCNTGLNAAVPISIVMPSYNQGNYIGQAINSVVRQNYLNRELIIMDGGSTDGTIDVIQSHIDNIDFWTSEPDEGQSDAINKGIARSTGDLVAWLNTDDYLLPSCLEMVARRYREADEPDIITANVLIIDEQGEIRKCVRVPRQSRFLFERGVWYTPAPCIFFKRDLFERIGRLDVSFALSMDVDMWFKMMKQSIRVEHIGEYLGGFRLHADSKSVRKIMSGTPGSLGAVCQETENVHAAHGISEALRRRWWLAYKAFQCVNLNYARAYIDRIRFRNMPIESFAQACSIH